MTTLMTRGKAGIAASALVFVAAVAGCSQEEPGTAIGSGGSTTATPGSQSSAPTTRSASGSATAVDDIDPCELLPSAAATGLGLTSPGKPRTVANRPVCSWQGNDFGVLVGTSTRGLVNATGQSVPLAKHKALQTTDTGGFGGCGVFVEVSANSSVIISAVLNGGRPAEEACPKAVDVAKIVDTTLP